MRRSRLIFTGQADHAGTTPMERRRDAFLAAADYALHARELVVERGGGRSVTNIGVVYVHPGRQQHRPRPHRARARDARAPTPTLLERLAQACETLAQEIGQRRGIGVEIRRMSATTPARVLATRAGAPSRPPASSSASAAAHCTPPPATTPRTWRLVTDAGMIFIPSRGGKSHRVDETSDADAIERGANVLLRTLLDLAA